MQDKSPSKPVKFIRRHKIASVILTSIAILLLLAYGVPVFAGDGTEKFTGTARKMAKETLRDYYSNEDQMSRSLHVFDRFQYYVESVQEMPVQEAKQYCKLPDGDDGTGYYYVEISRVTFFGMRILKHQENLLSSCSNSRYIKNTP